MQIGYNINVEVLFLLLRWLYKIHFVSADIWSDDLSVSLWSIGQQDNWK